ncbi:plant invertase/pectin methylesterase inhibitor [Striga asiatica]|uniref:pectinesterase n=1 Tax=Striga asiatica TaxID=4170 RepID=A0A5A7QY73_STRAF|nr:plant invertase/pectin methylesterase inhibitor [Striga asiatica]
MAILKSIVLCVLTTLATISWARKVDFVEEVKSRCGLTRYPALCSQTLTEGGLAPNVHMLSALINKTLSESKLPNSNFEALSSHFISPEAQQARLAIDDCHDLMGMSVRRLNQAVQALETTKSPEKHKEDIQTWLSAAITFQQACKDSVEGHVASNAYAAEIHRKMDHLSELVSNPLALTNQITKDPTAKLFPKGRGLNSFPGWVSGPDRKLLQSTEIRANAVVAKDGSGDYTTVTEAIRAAFGARFVIYVKSGTYNERINSNKDGIMLIGDGKYSTIITGSGSVAKGSTLRGSATFTITGDGFIARDIGFSNTAGPHGEQAVALTVSSDRSVMYRCSIAGYQDTLYALSLRQFYRDCDIYGTIDFIFGNAAAVLQSCSIVLRQPRLGGAYNVVLASGRTDPGQNTGFAVHNSRISGSGGSFLGRPWKQYARVVVMRTNIDASISGPGWVQWPGADASTYRTLYFAEYDNMGPGARLSGRVGWPGFRVIGSAEAEKFTVANFIGGNSWLPSTRLTGHGLPHRFRHATATTTATSPPTTSPPSSDRCRDPSVKSGKAHGEGVPVDGHRNRSCQQTSTWPPPSATSPPLRLIHPATTFSPQLRHPPSAIILQSQVTAILHPHHLRHQSGHRVLASPAHFTSAMSPLHRRSCRSRAITTTIPSQPSPAATEPTSAKVMTDPPMMPVWPLPADSRREGQIRRRVVVEEMSSRPLITGDGPLKWRVVMRVRGEIEKCRGRQRRKKTVTTCMWMAVVEKGGGWGGRKRRRLEGPNFSCLERRAISETFPEPRGEKDLKSVGRNFESIGEAGEKLEQIEHQGVIGIKFASREFRLATCQNSRVPSCRLPASFGVRASKSSSLACSSLMLFAREFCFSSPRNCFCPRVHLLPAKSAREIQAKTRE